ncbi:hypothetical protein PtA15_6A487 [Puccinia triticina]|uniref:CID domain-containing protein n=1 Tax=Puccinia triticina TaxID=208348 RepID=A0ABY7CND4_9BASI|nr:uncharacterized protein PtA15_6A487 [Puccinia triticina]WAQ85858.1 hypothetical protein PtA15_6A487 [Puccinia triticina]
MAIAPLLTYLSSVKSVPDTMRKLKKVWHNAGLVKVVQSRIESVNGWLKLGSEATSPITNRDAGAVEGHSLISSSQPPSNPPSNPPPYLPLCPSWYPPPHPPPYHPRVRCGIHRRIHRRITLVSVVVSTATSTAASPSCPSWYPPPHPPPYPPRIHRRIRRVSTAYPPPHPPRIHRVSTAASAAYPPPHPPHLMAQPPPVEGTSWLVVFMDTAAKKICEKFFQLTETHIDKLVSSLVEKISNSNPDTMLYAFAGSVIVVLVVHKTIESQDSVAALRDSVAALALQFEQMVAAQALQSEQMGKQVQALKTQLEAMSARMEQQNPHAASFTPDNID